jgi:hypothetical protein
LFTLGSIALDVDATAAAAICRSEDAGATWSTNLFVQTGEACSSNAFAADPSGGDVGRLYAGGTTQKNRSDGALYVGRFAGGPYQKGRSTSYWVVRRSQDGAAGSWENVDWSLPYAAVRSIVTVPRVGLPDEICAAGYAVAGAGTHWLVRKGWLATLGPSPIRG